MATSMLRGAAANALRRRSSSSLWRSLPPRGLRISSAAWPPLWPPPAAAAASLRHLSGGVTESERSTRKSIEEAKAELLRQLMREDAAADGEKTTARRTEELVGFLRRQIQHDAPGERADKHLLLSLLVRAARAEEKLSEETPRVELLEKRMGMTCLGLVFSVFVVFFGLPAIVALHLIVKLLRLVF